MQKKQVLLLLKLLIKHWFFNDLFNFLCCVEFISSWPSKPKSNPHHHDKHCIMRQSANIYQWHSRFMSPNHHYKHPKLAMMLACYWVWRKPETFVVVAGAITTFPWRKLLSLIWMYVAFGCLLKQEDGLSLPAIL